MFANGGHIISEVGGPECGDLKRLRLHECSSKGCRVSVIAEAAEDMTSMQGVMQTILCWLYGLISTTESLEIEFENCPLLCMLVAVIKASVSRWNYHM